MTELHILYTTLARVVAPPDDAGSRAPKGGGGRDRARDRGRSQGDRPGGGDSKHARALHARSGAGAGIPAGNGSDAAGAVRAAVDAMSASLCGLQATLPELWCAATGCHGRTVDGLPPPWVPAGRVASQSGGARDAAAVAVLLTAQHQLACGRMPLGLLTLGVQRRGATAYVASLVCPASPVAVDTLSFPQHAWRQFLSSMRWKVCCRVSGMWWLAGMWRKRTCWHSRSAAALCSTRRRCSAMPAWLSLMHSRCNRCEIFPVTPPVYDSSGFSRRPAQPAAAGWKRR